MVGAWEISIESHMSERIRERINSALKVSVKAQNKARTSTLRLVNAAIKDRDIASRTSGVNDGVSDDEILDILAKMIKQRRESVQTYEEAGRVELAEREAEEIEIIAEFMPRQMENGEVEQACKDVVEEIGAEGLKDMGRTMAALKERFAGRMDFGRASGLVKGLLG